MEVLAGLIDRATGGRPDPAKEDIARLQKLLRVAQGRRSGPRCLTCGSANTQELTFGTSKESQSFEHECGGRLYLLPEEPGAPRISYRPEVITLDVEGRRA
jgi:hypothetical protein